MRDKSNMDFIIYQEPKKEFLAGCNFFPTINYFKEIFSTLEKKSSLCLPRSQIQYISTILDPISKFMCEADTI